MPIRFQVGVRDCGHWNAPFQDSINFATLHAQAADCASCAAITNWILATYASRCDSETETERVAVMYATRKNNHHSWRILRRRFGLSCVRAAWFTQKFTRDLGSILLFCGIVILSIASVPTLVAAAVGATIIAASAMVLCCCGYRTWNRFVLGMITSGIPGAFALGAIAVVRSCSRVGTSILHMLGANFGRGEDRVAPPIWTEMVHQESDMELVRRGVSDMESGISDGMKLPITQLRTERIPLVHAWFRFPVGSSCIRISTFDTSPISPGLGCNIYRHTYNPRGPIGSLFYFALRTGQRENHPAGFLSLAAGKLFWAACKSMSVGFLQHKSPCP